MKIGISTASIERKNDNHGIFDGIGHYTMQLINQLQTTEHSIEAFSFPKFFKKKTNRQHSQTFPYSYPWHVLLSYVYCQPLHLNNLDLFHFTDYKIIRLNCPVVATIHDAIPLIHPEWLSTNIKAKFIPMILRRNIQYTDKVIAVSYHAANDIVQYFNIHENRIEIIPCSIHQKWLIQLDTRTIHTVMQKYNIQKPYLLTVGTLNPRKNFDRNIDAFMNLPDQLRQQFILVMVGKYGWQCDRLVEKIRVLTKSGHLLWLNHVNHDDELQSLYQGARALVVPSLYEGFGLPILEAFASATPVITSNITSMPEICGDAALKVDPYSIKQISDAMYTILTNDSIANDLVQRGKERLKIFNAPKTLSKIIQLYQQLCG